MSLAVVQLEMNLIGGSFPTEDEPKGARRLMLMLSISRWESLLRHAIMRLRKEEFIGWPNEDQQADSTDPVKVIDRGGTNT